MEDATQTHFQWLASELDRGRLAPSAALIDRLRRKVSPGRAHLLLQQVALRYKARRKFSRSEALFFLPVLLEQSTSEAISRYKATVLPKQPFADLCCGLGGDALGPVLEGVPVTCVDRSEFATELAAHNTRVYAPDHQATVVAADVTTFPIGQFAAWHLDPDRRPKGYRTTQLATHQPGVEVLRSLLDQNPNGLLKLAPATELPDDWDYACEREWIGELRECKQQWVRHGMFAGDPGTHRATIIGSDGQVLGSVEGQPDNGPGGRVQLAFTDQPLEYLYEPHATVRAAGLTRQVAQTWGLSGIGRDAAWLTGPQIKPDASLARFRVVDAMPFHRKRVKQRIASLQWGTLEVKTRGVPLDPRNEQKVLSTGKEGAAGCVFLFAIEKRQMAILAQRG